MSARNTLPENLPQLQNLIKRDPSCYREEFIQQWKHYQSTLEVFQLNPGQGSKSLEDLIMFISQVCHCYPDEVASFPLELRDFLNQSYSSLDPDVRMTCCKALMLLRNKNLLSPLQILELFFKLLNCKDKLLRKTLYAYIVSDIKNINMKHKNNKVNTALQNFMFSMLKDSSHIASKLSLDVMIELYRRKIWNDSKTVNVIVTACHSKFVKVMVAALTFFLGSDESDNDGNKSDSDSEKEDTSTTAKKLLVAGAVSRKSAKKKKKLEKALSLLRKSKKKHKPVAFNFSAIHLINDPQGFAERLFKQLEASTEKYEVRILMINLISRLIGIHELLVLNFYPYLQRLLQPHQRDVTKLLAYAAQASHSLVPPDAIEPVVMTIVNNFVSERNSSEVMAVGLNALRELCARAPLVMSADILQDLAQFRSAKNKGVMMAARSLVQLYRKENPDLLRRKDRGKPDQMQQTVAEYGATTAKSYVVGTDVLEKEENNPGARGKDEDGEGWETDDETDDSEDGEWVDMAHSEDETAAEALDDDQLAKAELISQTRILTDEDFNKIQKQTIIDHVSGKKMSRKRKRQPESSTGTDELVNIASIEDIYKKRNHDKASRIASVLEGREGRKKFGSVKSHRSNEFASTTNKEKARKKPFMMISHTKRVAVKKKRSFRDKQIALRDSLLKKQKMKR